MKKQGLSYCEVYVNLCKVKDWYIKNMSSCEEVPDRGNIHAYYEQVWAIREGLADDVEF